MEYTIAPAERGDIEALAELHAESWRTAYRGLLPDAFLAGPVREDRRALWTERLAAPHPRQLVLKAVGEDGRLAGLACVLLDSEPEWGPCLDNLHVRPDLKGLGLGRRLFQACREWSGRAAPGRPFHLWVMEGNLPARRFYDRLGGTVRERQHIPVVEGIEVPELRYVWPAP